MSHPHRDAVGNERWVLLGGGLFGLGALVAVVVDEYQPVKLAPVFMLVSWFPLIALHEAGHAVAARLLGWEVEELAVGFGRVAFRFEVYGVPCAIKMYPLGGFVRPAPLGREGLRLKSAAIYLAGPAVELGLGLALGLALGFETLLTRSDHVGVIAAQGVCLAALVSVLSNLAPRPVEMEHGEGATDGLGALRSLFGPRSRLEAQLRAAWLDRLERPADPGEAVARAERAWAALPGDPHLRSAIHRSLRAALRDLDDAERTRRLEGRRLP